MVGYVISSQDMNREVITPGGGGDKVSYFPYKDLDYSLSRSLERIFSGARRLEQISQVDNNLDMHLVLEPKITTDSSSSSFMFWPPEIFTITLNCDAYDRMKNRIFTATGTGHGNATPQDWRADFGIAGKRAMEDAIRILINNFDHTKVNHIAAIQRKKKTLLVSQERIESPILPSQTEAAVEESAYRDEITVPTGSRGRYYAVVIGNNNYQYLPRLKTAKNDAQTVARILNKEYGFNVKILLDAKRADILVAISKLRETLTRMDNLLIYYAGHGWLDKEGDEGYWLPVDATKDNEINWISNSSITTQIKAMEANHVLIVADSCYSGKLGRSIHIQKRAPDYYSRIAKKRARSVIASGGLEPVIDSGGKGNHSVFASAFIEALQGNNHIMDTSELFNIIRRPIVLNADQTPEYADIRKAGHDGGEFLFIRKK